MAEKVYRFVITMPHGNDLWKRSMKTIHEDLILELSVKCCTMEINGIADILLLQEQNYSNLFNTADL